MSRFLVPLLSIGLCVAGTSVSAATTDYRIAVIDPTRIVEQSPQYEAARAQLQEEVGDREKKLIEQQKQIAELQKKLKKDAALMSEEEIQRLQNDIRNRDRKAKYAQAELREDFSLRQNELRTKLAKQVEEVVTELARDENIDLIISEGLVYYSKRMDISDQVIERLKAKFKAK